MDLPFIDLDAHIEERTGKNPRELYAEGADYFRNRETEALGAALSPAAASVGRILAAGGGIIDNAEAMKLLEGYRAGTVYLEVSAETAWERISRGELPPFLNGGNPREQHRLLHQRRSGEYARYAALSIRGEGKTPEETAKNILLALIRFKGL
jgi:shikimate kinase